MKTAAIYCRVSTEEQGKEGTSLESQRAACMAKAIADGYQVLDENVFIEKYSGLSLDRPELSKLQALVKGATITAIIAHTPDRLSRRGEDILQLAKEFKSNGVKLLFVKEQWDDTLNGKLIAFILGWASEFEASQIRERTMRGKRARALQGRLPSGAGRKLYGYDYLPGKGLGEGIRYVNKEQAKWVNEIFRWFVEERLSINGITRRLRDLGVPTPAGSNFWIRQSVYRILTNCAYIGKTFAFTKDYVEPKRRRNPNTRRKKTGVIVKPKDQWLEIPKATPPIISEQVFETAQVYLKKNKELSQRNRKRDYLLSGYIFCRCGARYQGYLKKWKDNGKPNSQRWYRCGKSQTIVTPDPCPNRQLHGPKIEEAIWREIETRLSKPEMLLQALEMKGKEAEQLTTLQNSLAQAQTQIENRAKQKERIWRAFELTGDEGAFKKDVERLDQEVRAIEQEKSELEQKIEAYQNYEIDANRVKEACKLYSDNLKNMTYQDKRLALEALQIRVVVEGDKIVLNGIIPMASPSIESSVSRLPTPHWLISPL